MKTLRALQFLFVGPAILVMLVVIHWMTDPGDGWVKWAVLGIGIAWFACLFQVLRTVVILGGLAAFLAWLHPERGA